METCEHLLHHLRQHVSNHRMLRKWWASHTSLGGATTQSAREHMPMVQVALWVNSFFAVVAPSVPLSPELLEICDRDVELGKSLSRWASRPSHFDRTLKGPHRRQRADH